MPDFTDKLKPKEPSGPSSLAKERVSSCVPVKDLSRHLFPDGFLERQARVLKDLEKERLVSKATQLNLSRPDRYKLGLARAKLLRRKVNELKWDGEDVKMCERMSCLI